MIRDYSEEQERASEDRAKAHAEAACTRLRDLLAQHHPECISHKKMPGHEGPGKWIFHK